MQGSGLFSFALSIARFKASIYDSCLSTMSKVIPLNRLEPASYAAFTISPAFPHIFYADKYGIGNSVAFYLLGIVEIVCIP